MAVRDSFSQFDHLLTGATTDPWRHQRGAPAVYQPDYALLGLLLSVPVGNAAVSESGSFANGVDAWTAAELRRAGFDGDEIWPRAARPRVLPRDVAVMLEKVPAVLRAELTTRLAAMPAVAPVSARVLGRAYEKQVDVLLSRWDRGPEILISTKAQLSSFGKNLPNRFEESYGDVANLCGRYPLAATGFLFVQRATILDSEPEAFERSVDMIRKLRRGADVDGYTATALLLVDWDDDGAVHARPDLVPDDVRPDHFFVAVVDHVLAVTPVNHHVRVRELRQRRVIRVD